MSIVSKEMLDRTNAYRRQRFEEAAADGCRWLVECTDDFVFGIPSYDDDDGVFFVDCKTDADVNALIDEYEGTLNICRDVIDLQTPINTPYNHGQLKCHLGYFWRVDEKVTAHPWPGSCDHQSLVVWFE